MKVIYNISRLLTGFVFVFSGFVKGIDPLGSAYKFSDYFSAFHLEFLDNLALPLAIVLCTAEFIAGLMLVSGSYTKLAAWIVSIFMLIFTPLTLILALYNPVSDCGCFGDAIHLTNWQTFYKNLIISAFVLIIFLKRNEKPAKSDSVSHKTVTIGLIAFILFVLTNLLYLPVIDFRPYKPGTNIKESMSVPENAPSDKYDIRFIYKKEGVEKEFTLENYPANDTTWKFVDQKSVLIFKGYTPPIHDFALVTADGTDRTDDIVSYEGYSLLMVSKKTEDAGIKKIKKGIETGSAAVKNGIRFYILTSSSKDVTESISQEHTLLYGDETTLKTIIRANPGFVLIKNGVVKSMWSSANLPGPSEFNDPEKIIKSFVRNNHIRKIFTFSIFGILLLISIFISCFKTEMITKHKNTH